MPKDVKSFLKETTKLTGEAADSAIEEFREIAKRESLRIIKDQLASEMSAVLDRLASIEQQQNIIIGMLKSKLDLDAYEREIMDLLKKKLKQG